MGLKEYFGVTYFKQERFAHPSYPDEQKLGIRKFLKNDNSTGSAYEPKSDR